MRVRVPLIFLLLAPLFLFAHSAVVAQPVLSVDLDAKTTDPKNPIFNRVLGETVVVAAKAKDMSGFVATIDMPAYTPTEGDMGVKAANFFISIRPCKGAKINATGYYLLGGVHGSAAQGEVQCPSAKLEKSGPESIGWTVYVSKNETINIHLATKNDSYNIPLKIVEKPFALEFSGGLAFIGARDQRFQLSADSDAAKMNLARISDGDVSYKVAAFSHYTLIKHPWFGLVAGLGTDVPSGNIAPMLGVSFSAQTLPIADHGNLLFGIAFAQSKKLKAQYEGLSTVPSAVTVDSLTELRSGVTYFIGFSFGFFKGEDKFKSLFPGQAAGSGSP